MMRAVGLFVAVSALVMGCAGVPKSRSERAEVTADAHQTLQEMVAKDPDVQGLIDQSAGYIIFPSVKQGGAIVGGAGGSGVVYENGRRTGYAALSQASIGAQLGGQKYSELVIVRDRDKLESMKSGKFDVGAQASAVILKQGAASATRFGKNGVAVFVQPKGGAMVNVSVSGQQISFRG